MNPDKFLGNMAGAPIPGQSLTREPGSRPYETPPQFTTVDDAMEKFVLPRILNPQSGAHIAALMDRGIPATSITDSLLITGFSQGMWTPDLATLIALPTYSAVIKSAELVGGPVLRGNEEQFKKKTDALYEKLAEEADSNDADESESVGGVSFMDMADNESEDEGPEASPMAMTKAPMMGMPNEV